jgi:hypothetical protein
MNETISGKELIARGWKTGPELGAALRRANEVLSGGGNREEALAAAGLPPAEPSTLSLRAAPVELTAAVGAPETEEEAGNLAMVREHMSRLLRVPVVTAATVMPDCCPSGPSPITVGGAIAAENALLPDSHSADICCSMCATFYTSSFGASQQLNTLMQVTRFGQGGRPEHQWVDHPVIGQRDDSNPFLKGLDRYVRMHLADQGDGNHFSYIGQLNLTAEFLGGLDQAGYSDLAQELSMTPGEPFVYVLVTHHGSRGLGAQVYKRGQEVAERFARRLCPETPKGTEWIPFETPEGQQYWKALQYVQDWTKANHEIIHTRFALEAKAQSCGRFFNAHNFVWRRGDLFLHGKGATPAWKDDTGRPLLGLIPLNMASPILIVAGNDNARYLSFAPHGAGRNRSRTATIQSFANPDEMEKAYTEATRGVDVRWYSGKKDVSESPLGYKNAQKVKSEIQQFGLATVIGEIQPLGCIMAGEQPEPFWKKKKK